MMCPGVCAMPGCNFPLTPLHLPMPHTISTAIVNILGLLLVLLGALLLKFIRERDKQRTPHPDSHRPGGTTTSTRVVLADTTMPSPEALQSVLQDLWHIVPEHIATTGNSNTRMYSIPLGKASVLITMRQEPLPLTEFQGVSPSGFLWDSAASDLQNHSAFIAVDVMSEQLSTALRYLLCTHITATVALRANAVAVHIPDQQLIFHPNFYIEAAIQAASDEYFPVHLWVEVVMVANSEGRINAYTKGLEHMGKKELELHDSDSEPQIISNILMHVAYFSILADEELQDGQELPLPEDIHVTVRQSASLVIGRSNVYRVEL